MMIQRHPEFLFWFGLIGGVAASAVVLGALIAIALH